MRALFDVNVLIARFDPAHVHHERAHRWWKLNKTSGWASCPLTENGFVRILSQPKYPNTIPTRDALRRLIAEFPFPGSKERERNTGSFFKWSGGDGFSSPSERGRTTQQERNEP